MQGIVFLVPTAELLEIAEQIRLNHPNIARCKMLTNEWVEEEARAAVDAGASVIVARGTQAARIRRTVNIPVVDIVWTVQKLWLTGISY